MKIGITGSSGVLGQLCHERFLSKGYDVSCFKRDIRDAADIEAWLKKNHLNAVLHFAAIVETDRVKKDPLNAYHVNVCGTINLLMNLRKCGFKGWFFYASSSHVYCAQNRPIEENDEIAPTSLYGMTKYMGEKICSDFSESAPFQICIGRIFSFYHNFQSGSFLYPTIKQRLQTENLDKPFFLRGANSVRDFLNADEVCEIIIALMDKKYRGIINIASGKGTKIGDFVQSMTEANLKIESDDSENSIVGSVDKLRKVLNR